MLKTAHHAWTIDLTCCLHWPWHCSPVHHQHYPESSHRMDCQHCLAYSQLQHSWTRSCCQCVGGSHCQCLRPWDPRECSGSPWWCWARRHCSPRRHDRTGSWRLHSQSAAHRRCCRRGRRRSERGAYAGRSHRNSCGGWSLGQCADH